jgi:hypothetical protein
LSLVSIWWFCRKCSLSVKDYNWQFSCSLQVSWISLSDHVFSNWKFE